MRGDARKARDRDGRECHHTIFYGHFSSSFTHLQWSLAHFSCVSSLFLFSFSLCFIVQLVFTLFSFISPLSSHAHQEDKMKQDILQGVLRTP